MNIIVRMIIKMAKEIILTRGKVALVDDIDYENLSKFKWHAQKSQIKTRENWYARRRRSDFEVEKIPGPRNVYMHKEIIRSSLVDHIDGNGLNNQRGNLRPCNYFLNNGNRRKSSGCSSRFKGVYPNRKKGRWYSQIMINGKSLHCGMFKYEIDAAKAYDKKAIEIFGEFAHTNF